jgi:hypothetical protein
MLIMFSPLYLILHSSPMSCLCHANQLLNCRVVKQLEPYMCVLGFRFHLKLDKLHCIIIAMSCMHSHEHADSLAVVVSVVPVVCCRNLLLSE